LYSKVNMWVLAFLYLLSLVNGNHSPFGLKRVIAGSGQVEYPNGQPIPPVNLLTLLDPYHVRMLSFPWYNAAYESSQKAAAFHFFQTTYGLNFSAAFHNSTLDLYLLPEGALAPYSIMPNTTTYRVQLDTKHKDHEGKWVPFIEAGWIFQGALTTGVYGGQVSQIVPRKRLPGDIIIFTDYNTINSKSFNKHNVDWTSDRHREVFKGRTLNPGRQQVNGEDALNTLSQVEVTDKYGNNGRFVDGTFRNRNLAGNWVATASSIITFYL
jgi:hypothetical protein